MTSTVQLLTVELNASTVFLSGDIAMRPGELPALTSPPLTSVSISPSTITRPGKAVALATLCDARTRVVTPLGGLATVGPPPPQETRGKLAARSRAGTSALFPSNFKRQAPNKMKHEDLAAK